MGTIVVGVDGSPGAREALGLALQEARLRGDRLRAVTAWHVPSAVYAGGYAPAVDPATFEGDAEALLARELEALGAEARGVEIERVLQEGQPARVLLDASRDAELLVVGSRGLGGFAGLLLGSVSQQCVHHSSCPVLVARAPTEPRADHASS